MVSLCISTNMCCGLAYLTPICVCDLCRQYDMVWNALIDSCLFLSVRLVL